jgi:iron complex transport system permease protein
MDREVILTLRLPRALAAFGCGALLALAGALLQALLRNPLADPYVLGISGGAGAGILLAMMLGLGGLALGLAGLGGAGLSMAVLLLLAWRDGLRPQRLLLAGVILSTTWGALVTLLLALAPDAPLRGMVFWLMGDLSGVDPALAPLPLAGALLALLTVWPLAHGFDALARGELTARALGVPVDRLRLVALALAAAAAVLVVQVAGSIGFVGLVAPHLLRLAGLRRHRALLPGCALGGGILVLTADLAARTIVAPLQLPVGAVTAALGAPVFLWLLARSAR